MKTAELQERTKSFALRVLNLIERLPNTIGGSVLANQIARRSKLGTVAEEADESLYWLELIRDGKFVSGKRIASLVSEADELTAIFTSGRRSASRPQPSKIKPQTSLE